MSVNLGSFHGGYARPMTINFRCNSRRHAVALATAIELTYKEELKQIPTPIGVECIVVFKRSFENSAEQYAKLIEFFQYPGVIGYYIPNPI